MKIACLIALCAAFAVIAGCGENRWRTQEATSFYTAQQQLVQNRKPLFELKAQPGQVIQLSGVESLTVNDPREARVEALPEHRSQFLDTALKVFQVGAQIYGVKVAADGVVNLADTIGKNAGDHGVTNITGSYNTQGDTLSNSIKGNVTGNGSGVGNTYHDGSVNGTGNASGTNNGVQNGNDNRQDSTGPTTGGGANCSGGAGGTSGDTGSSAGAGSTGCTGGPAGG